jgi:hypothetical protein
VSIDFYFDEKCVFINLSLVSISVSRAGIGPWSETVSLKVEPSLLLPVPGEERGVHAIQDSHNFLECQIFMLKSFVIS